MNLKVRRRIYKMKYTRTQFDAIIECFDNTIAFAEKIGTVSFDCNPLFEAVEASCRRYCLLYREDSASGCMAFYDAKGWKSLKEQFIAEHGPKD